jgi:DNA-binding SARP family transcriptional activator
MTETTESSTLRIRLIPGLSISRGSRAMPFRSTSAKLIALLALHRKPVERTVVASTLWPEVRDSRAAANLRTVMWRVGNTDGDLIRTTGTRLHLDPTAEVDLREHERLAHRILNREPLEALAAKLGAADPEPMLTGSLQELNNGIVRIIRCLTDELLVNLFDDWLAIHQERWRQLRLHALDSLSAQLTGAGYHAAAVDAATASVAAEPLRESGYRSLITAHLAEGNLSEAIQTHERYRQLLEDELGIAPSLQMYELVSRATGTASPSGHGEAPPAPDRYPYPTRPDGPGVRPNPAG